MSGVRIGAEHNGQSNLARATISRRSFLGTAAAAGVGLFVVGCGSDDAGSSDPLVALEWGGIWERGILPLSKSFTDKTGIVINNTVNSGSKLTVLSQNPGKYDMAWVIGNQAAKGLQSGVLSSVDTGAIDAWDNLYQPLTDAVKVDGKFGGVPISYGVSGILWRQDLVPFKIEHWKDLWRPELKGKISLQTAPNLGSIFTVMCAAQAFANDYKDLEAGWDAIDKLKDNVSFLFDSEADAINKLAAGDIWAMPAMADFGLGALEKTNTAVTVPPEGAPWSPQYVVIPSASKRQEDIQSFVNYLLEPDNQIEWVKKERVAPSNSAVKLPASVQSTIVETPEVAKSLWDINWLELGETSDEWTLRWTKAFQ